MEGLTNIKQYGVHYTLSGEDKGLASLLGGIKIEAEAVSKAMGEMHAALNSAFLKVGENTTQDLGKAFKDVYNTAVNAQKKGAKTVGAAITESVQQMAKTVKGTSVELTPVFAPAAVVKLIKQIEDMPVSITPKLNVAAIEEQLRSRTFSINVEANVVGAKNIQQNAQQAVQQTVQKAVGSAARKGYVSPVASDASAMANYRRLHAQAYIQKFRNGLTKEQISEAHAIERVMDKWHNEMLQAKALFEQYDAENDRAYVSGDKKTAQSFAIKAGKQYKKAVEAEKNYRAAQSQLAQTAFAKKTKTGGYEGPASYFNSMMDAEKRAFYRDAYGNTDRSWFNTPGYSKQPWQKFIANRREIEQENAERLAKLQAVKKPYVSPSVQATPKYPSAPTLPQTPAPTPPVFPIPSGKNDYTANLKGNFSQRAEEIKTVARNVARLQKMFGDGTNNKFDFTVTVKTGGATSALTSLETKANSVRTAITKPMTVDIKAGDGRTQLSQAVKNLKSWTTEVKELGKTLGMVGNGKGIPAAIEPFVPKNTPPVPLEGEIIKFINTLGKGMNEVDVIGAVKRVVNGINGMKEVDVIGAVKRVVNGINGMDKVDVIGAVKQVSNAMTKLGEVPILGVVKDVQNAANAIKSVEINGILKNVLPATGEGNTVTVKGILDPVTIGKGVKSVKVPGKIDTANLNEQIKAFKPTGKMTIHAKLGWGTGKEGKAAQLKALQEGIKPIPMEVSLSIDAAKSKLQELKAYAASLNPLNMTTNLSGANKGRVQDSTKQTIITAAKENAKQQTRTVPKSGRSTIVAPMPSSASTRAMAGGNDFYSRLRKGVYPFTGNTSFGARTPMALDMAKGMGMMFAVSGVMQTVTGAFHQVTEYENMMKTVDAILRTNDTGANFGGRFKDMENEIRRVGRETKFTAPEVAGAAKFMAMAGLNIEDINAATNPVANLALVGDNDLTETADKMTNIMTSFGLLKGLSAAEKKRNMIHTSDVLTNTFTKSNTNLLQLAEAMQYAGPMSHLTGTALEDAAAMVGVMGNAGIQASMAGTTLRMMYQNIVKPNKKQAAEWDRLGIKRTDANGRVRDIFDILSDLRAKITGTTDINAPVDKEQLKIMGAEVMSLFRTTAGAGTAALLENLGEAKRLAESNRTANGVAQDIANEKKNTIAGLWAQVTSTFTDQSVNTVSEFTETIKEMLCDLRDWLASKEAAETLRTIYDLAKDILGIFKEVAKFWKNVFNFAPNAMSLFIKFQLLATQFGFVLGGITQVVGALSAFRKALFGVLGVAKMLPGTIQKTTKALATGFSVSAITNAVGGNVAAKSGAIGLASVTPSAYHAYSAVASRKGQIPVGFVSPSIVQGYRKQVGKYYQRVPWFNANGPMFMGNYLQKPLPLGNRNLVMEGAMVFGSATANRMYQNALIGSSIASLFPGRFGVGALYANNPVPSASGRFNQLTKYTKQMPRQIMPFGSASGKAGAVLWNANGLTGEATRGYAQSKYAGEYLKRAAFYNAMATAMVPVLNKDGNPIHIEQVVNGEKKKSSLVQMTYKRSAAERAALMNKANQYMYMHNAANVMAKNEAIMARSIANTNMMGPGLWYMGSAKAVNPVATVANEVQAERQAKKIAAQQALNKNSGRLAQAWTKDAAMVTMLKNQNRLSLSNAATSFGTMFTAGRVAGGLNNPLRAGYSLLSSMIVNLAKGLGMLLSPIGLVTMAVGGLAIGLITWFNNIEEHNKQLAKATEDAKSITDKMRNVRSQMIEDDAELGGLKPVEVGYQKADSDFSNISLSGNKIVSNVIDNDKLNAQEIYNNYVKPIQEYLPRHWNNFHNGANKATDNMKIAAVTGQWIQTALDQEGVKKDATAIREALAKRDLSKAWSIVESYKPNAKAPRLLSMKSAEEVRDANNVGKYYEIQEAQHSFLESLIQLSRPITYYNKAMQQFDILKNIERLDIANRKFEDFAHNIVRAQPLMWKGKAYQVQYDGKGNVNWTAMAKSMNDDVMFSLKERNQIMSAMYQGISSDERLNKVPSILDLLRTYLPKIANLPTPRMSRTDDEIARDYAKFIQRDKTGKDSSYDVFRNWLTNRGYDLKTGKKIGVSSNTAGGVTPPSQEGYKSHYQNHARPTQIVFNIDQLCKFDNTQVNNLSDKGIAESVGRQMAEGLNALFAQAAAQYQLLGEGSGFETANNTID